MLVYPSGVDVSSSALRFLSACLRQHRGAIGSRWRRLNPGRQALLALAHLRMGHTYAQLAAAAEEAAAALATLGLPSGQFIALPACRSAGFVAAALGVLQAGHAYLPLDESEPPERQALRRRDAAALLRWSGPGPFDFAAESLTPGEPAPAAAPALRPAYLLYTSGSTGRPKGVVVPHKAIARLVLNNGYADFTAADRVAFAANPAFDAVTLEVWAPLLNGGAVVVIDQDVVLAPARLAAAVERLAIPDRPSVAPPVAPDFQPTATLGNPRQPSAG